MAIARYLAIIVVVLGALIMARSIRRGSAPNAEQTAAARPTNTPVITDATARWMLGRARTQLGRVAAEAQPRSSAPLEATQARAETLFVSIYPDARTERNENLVDDIRARKPFVGVIGRGPNLALALDNGVSNVLAGLGPAGDPLGAFASGAYRIKLDVLTGELKDFEKPSDVRMTAAELIDVGSEGLEVTAAGSHFYLLPAELIYSGLIESAESETAQEVLDRAMVYLGFGAGRWRSRDVDLKTLHTVSFVDDASHTHALGLVRGYVSATGQDREVLLAAARNAGDYLVRMQNADGSFCYWYRALLDHADTSHYNIVRHAGTAISLFDLYRGSRDARYLVGARKSMAFLRSRFRQLDRTHPARLDHDQSELKDRGSSRASNAAPRRSGLYVLDDDNKAKLGAGGLALLAVTREMELDSKSGSSEAEELATGILAMQKPDGSFETDLSENGEELGAPPSIYYPGEAMLGLIRLYGLNHESRLLEGARRAADYLVGIQRKQRDLPPDAWLVQALESIFEVTKDPKYAEHALDLAASMAASLYPRDGPEGYIGAVSPGIPRVTPTASRSEAILAGYRIARATKDSRATQLIAAARAAAGFQLTQQFGSDNSFFLPNPGRAAGGFHESLDSMRIRIDYVQHNISSLLALAEVRSD